MIEIGDNKYYTNIEVAKITGKKSGSVQKYAKNNSLKTIGTTEKFFYLWTEEDLKKYQEYLKNIKPGRPYATFYKETDSLDSLYHRRLRAKKRGDNDLVAAIQEDIEKLRANKENPKL